jgi:nitrite reductase (NADH) large subunit
MPTTPRLLIIGNGMVGHKCLETLVARGAHTHYQIATFCEEAQLAYDRVHLSEYFSGRSAEDLSLVTPDFYEDHGITVYRGERVETIDRQRQVVISQQGREIPYDKLVLATGSFPFVPPIPGRDRSHCLIYRTLEDLEKIANTAKDSRVGTVIGGGLLGLECANALKELGLETHVVEFASRLMAVQMDDGGAIMLQRKIEKLGVQVHLSKNTSDIGPGNTCRHRLNFADGDTLETDLLVFSAGIRPRDELAQPCGLDIGPRGGIVIDNHCRTSDTNIYAIGECALWNGQIFGLVAPGYQMAKVAVDHLLEDATSSAFTGADMSTKLKLLGVDVASIGDGHGRTPGSRAYCFSDETQEIYKKIVVSENGKHLLGAVLVGDTDAYGNLLQLALNGIKLPPHPDTLILPQRDGSASPALGVDVLPDSAQICSCNNVSKGDLHGAIEGGVMALSDLKTCTKASTSCGGCAPLVKQVLDAELKRRGIAVNNHLCEHFPYSRQELYHLVRVEGIQSFKALLDSHGQGRGCDICKPAVASILASCWNEYVLKNQHTGLQDTNDRFLGNLQKDGTYSVVPRIPGGEISADKLIVLGQIAKNYGLYTKITGGQRIDMFGARVHQLPDIWRELVDAGFESGHAYAKALRTVKSCVGTSWCRYGVQDSVSMAIRVENRYRGLRSPHKIKMAVSGCTRECAEAQSKDVGVIATEKGWNLYVCGNGGMKPRHADLFATDLDDATLIRTIDRFLMFYIKTADRLQRTATWLNNLEGGLDYLRQVIIDDTLGIGAELEQQMADVIDTFQCEWKTTLEDPEKLKRFSHFVNSDEPDNRVVFVHERGQIRPAKAEEKVIRLREVG